MLGCNSHSLSSTASFKVTRPIPISITSAIASLEFSLVSSSPDWSFNTSGPNALVLNRKPHNDIVEEHLPLIVDLRMVRLRPSRYGENNRAGRPNDRRKRRQTHTRKTTLGRSGASTTVTRAW